MGGWWGATDEKKEEFWKGYVSILPEKYTDRIWMNEEEIEILKGTNNYQSTLMEQLKSEYDQIIPELQKSHGNLFPKEKFTFQNYLWANSSINSRAFPVLPDHLKQKFTKKSKRGAVPSELNQEKGEMEDDTMIKLDIEDEELKESLEATITMVPVIDMGNHSPHAKVTWIQNPSGMSLQIHYSVSPGSEVYLLPLPLAPSPFPLLLPLSLSLSLSPFPFPFPFSPPFCFAFLFPFTFLLLSLAPFIPLP